MKNGNPDGIFSFLLNFITTAIGTVTLTLIKWKAWWKREPLALFCDKKKLNWMVFFSCSPFFRFTKAFEINEMEPIAKIFHQLYTNQILQDRMKEKNARKINSIRRIEWKKHSARVFTFYPTYSNGKKRWKKHTE